MLAQWPDPGSMDDALGHPGPQRARATSPVLMQDAYRSGAMGAEIAHELANLITVVLGSLEQLRRQPLDDGGQQQLERAEWSAQHIARLTRQSLSRARGGSGAADVVDLNTAVDEFATVMGSRVDGGTRIATELAPGSLPVRLDAELLDLVLLNLVRNATDAMPNGGEVILRTRGSRLDGLGEQLTAEVSVSDNGMGMPPDVAQRATDAFFTTKPVGKGTGLGLWMAHSFASTHGGTVKIETAPRQGTTVRLSFPYAGEAAQD